jgi:hypothetical protein
MRNFSRDHTAEKYIRVLEKLLQIPERDKTEVAA